jgi:hypothetical protein
MSVVYYYWDADKYDWKLLPGSSYDSNPFQTLDAVGTITLATKDDGTVTLRPIHTVKVRVAYTADFVKDWFTERTVYDEFDVVFKEDCSDNAITLGAAIDDIEYYIGQTTISGSDTDFQIAYTVSVSSDACPINAYLYIKDPVDEAWVLYNSGSPTAYHAPVVQASWKSVNTGANLDAGYFKLRVDFGDKATYRSTWAAFQPSTFQPNSSEHNYKFRVELTDLAAIDPEAIRVFDEFEVNIYDKCWRNKLTLTVGSMKQDLLHTMEADGSTPASTVAVIAFTSIEDESECPLVRTIEIYDEVYERWDIYDEAVSAMSTKYPWISTSSIVNDSGFDVVTEDYSTYDDETKDPTVYRMRQTVEDQNSNESESKIYDYFDVTLKYECDDDVLSLTGPTDIPF